MVAVVAAKVAHKISKKLFLYRRGHNYDSKSLCSPEVASVVLPLHALTGADAVSGFYGHSKKTLFNGMVNNGQQSLQLISDLGREYSVKSSFSTSSDAIVTVVSSSYILACENFQHFSKSFRYIINRRAPKQKP